MPEPAKPADDKKAEQAKETAVRVHGVIKAVRDLTSVWESTGFYDRQDPALGLCLHEALSAYESKK